MRSIMRFLDNESMFGRICTFLGTIIITNLLFVITLLPVITAGAGACALYYSMLKLVRYKEINPLVEFFKGFRDNFKKATFAEIVIIAMAIFLIFDLRICSFMTTSLKYCVVVIYAILIALTIISMFLFPVIATFDGNLRTLVKFSVYFAGSNLFRTAEIAVLNIVPLLLTYTNPEMLPLAAFIWCMCGFAVIALCNSMILMRKFKDYLEPLEEDQETANRKKILEEMKKLES